MKALVGIAKIAALVGGVFVSMLAQADFKGTITLGSVLLGLLVLAIAGMFTIRAKIADTWRSEALAERAKAARLDEELKQERLDAKEAERARQAAIAEIEREQQELRHGLKDELAACRAALEVEKAKHDLTGVMEKMQGFHNEAMTAMAASTAEAVTGVTAAIQSLADKMDAGQQKLEHGQEEQRTLLTEIRDALREGRPNGAQNKA